MLRRSALLIVVLVPLGTAAVADAAEPQKLTVQVRGIVTEDDAAAVQVVLKGLAGIKVNPADVQRSEKPNPRHHFSAPFALELLDADQMDLGAIARAVAETKTPSRAEFPPSLNLVIFDRRAFVEEADVMMLREALGGVANAPGTIGGVPAEGRYWVRLAPTGEARLNDLRTALTRASLEFKLEKP